MLQLRQRFPPPNADMQKRFREAVRCTYHLLRVAAIVTSTYPPRCDILLASLQPLDRNYPKTGNGNRKCSTSFSLLPLLPVSRG